MTYASHCDDSQDVQVEAEEEEEEACNAKFQRDPKRYLEDKLVSGLFKRVWTTVVAKNLQAGFIFGRLAWDLHFDNVTRHHGYSWGLSGFCQWRRGAV